MELNQDISHKYDKYGLVMEILLIIVLRDLLRYFKF